jgi:hypothetical protein
MKRPTVSTEWDGVVDVAAAEAHSVVVHSACLLLVIA